MPKVNKTQSLNVIGMDCASCASVIKRKLEKMDGIESCEVNYGTEKAKVSYDPNKVSIPQMNQEIEKLGYSLEERGNGHHTMSDVDHQMDHSMHAGHDMMTPISSDKSVKERKLQELKKLEQHIWIVLPFVALSILVMVWEIGSSPLGLWPQMPL